MGVSSLKDKPEVVAQLNKNKDYNFNNIELVVHAYNGNFSVNMKWVLLKKQP